MPSINGLLTVWRNCWENQQSDPNVLINCQDCKVMNKIFDRTICDIFDAIEGST